MNRSAFLSSVALLGALSCQSAWGAGASVAFVTHEAESGIRSAGANIHQLSGTITGTTANPEFEASGRAYVRLDNHNEWVRWTNTVHNANRITIRFCVPDNGVDNSLSFRVNGTHRQNVQLNSRYAWLYGPAGTDGQSNSSSAGPAHAFWDDFRFSVSGAAIANEQTFEFRKDVTNQGNNAAYYLIDLVDVEVANGAGPPSNYIDVTAAPYNVVPNDGNDDRAKIQQAIDAAATASPKKSVWLPSGVYNLSGNLVVKGVTVKGAGYWNTRIEYTAKFRPFTLSNTGAQLQHMAITSKGETYRGGTDYAIQGDRGVAEQWNVQYCWIQHTGAGLWMSDSDNGSARYNRVYGTYADGINLNRGSHNNVVEHNYVRGTGDDGIAVISEVDNNGVVNPISTNNTVRFNTVVAPRWGVLMALRGGTGHVIEDNRFQDSTYGAGVALNLESAYNMYAITGATFRRNEIIRGGGPKLNGAGPSYQARGALWFYSGNKSITGVAFHNTTITNPIFAGVWHNAGLTDLTQNVTLNNTTISMNNNGSAGVRALGSALEGTATYTNGSITGTTKQFDDAADNHTLTWSGF